MSNARITITQAEYRALISARALVGAERESDDMAADEWAEDAEALDALGLKMARALRKTNQR